MKFTVDGTHYDFDETTLTNKEVMDIESRCSCTFGEWSDLLKRNSMVALTALVWIALRRERTDMKYGDVEFQVATFYDTAETDEAPPTLPADEITPNEPPPVLEAIEAG